MDLTDRKILVTGASSGIGRATAIYLSKLGATLVLNGRDENRLLETRNNLHGNTHLICKADLAQEQLDSLFDDAIADGKKLNGIVHCAGIPYILPLRGLRKKNVSNVMEVNFYPFIELCRLYIKKKYSSGGSVVCISSILSVRPRAYETGYIVSKGAMNVAVSSLAFEMATYNTRINGILAGNIMTEMVQRTIEKFGNEDHLTQMERKALLGIGQPDDIASVAAFLISDMSRFITGRMIYADGGLI